MELLQISSFTSTTSYTSAETPDMQPQEGQSRHKEQSRVGLKHPGAHHPEYPASHAAHPECPAAHPQEQHPQESERDHPTKPKVRKEKRKNLTT